MMGTKYALFFLLVLISASLCHSGCASESSYLVNLDFVKEAIVNYHESGNFRKDTERAVNEALEKFNKINPGEKSAVIFDVDEAPISNYQFIKEWDFGYVPQYFDMWIDSAKAPPIPEVLNLYSYLVGRNFKIVFITARKDFQYDATRKNLINAGYTVFDTIIVKDKKYHGMTALKFKSEKREELVRRGYTISGTVGDQWSDLEGPYHGIQVKIPNYQYIIY